MDCRMIVEQLGSQEYRMQYDDVQDRFAATSDRFLGYERGFTGVYGWIDGYGTPPGRHLDVFLPTARAYSLGEAVSIRIVGCFRRRDLDHKYIAVESGRREWTFGELPETERAMLKAIYPETREGEAWLEREDALALFDGDPRRPSGHGH